MAVMIAFILLALGALAMLGAFPPVVTGILIIIFLLTIAINSSDFGKGHK